MTIKTDKVGAVFCSNTCRDTARDAWHNLLHALDRVLPPELHGDMGELTAGTRDAAADEYAAWAKGAAARRANVLAARFIAK